MLKKGIDLEWTLDARYNKSTIPMARLAEYIAEYAALLGEGASVHLDRVDEGSVKLVAHVERDAKAGVLARCRAAGNDNAPPSLQKPYLKIAEMARWTARQSYCRPLDSIRPVARP